ncbi:MAG: hypothetical protein ACFKPT_10570 [Gloeotrichia echinulata GP01]
MSVVSGQLSVVSGQWQNINNNRVRTINLSNVPLIESTAQKIPAIPLFTSLEGIWC